MKRDIEKPFNNGSWTQARFNSFVKSALRGARWPCKYEAIKRAYVKDGINSKTGRKCKLHRCAKCGELFPQKDVAADHTTPVVGPEGFVSWDQFIQRLFVEADGYEILCKPCHKRKTDRENEERRMNRGLRSENLED